MNRHSDPVGRSIGKIRITVAAVGKMREKYFSDTADEYLKRLSRFCDIKIREVADEPVPGKLSDTEAGCVKRLEAERLWKAVGGEVSGKAAEAAEHSFLIALDRCGCLLTSEEFAEKINSLVSEQSVSRFVFLLGGSVGLDESLVRRADLIMSFSKMTFPHQLARVILLEQLFRAFKIINGEVYHK